MATRAEWFRYHAERSGPKKPKQPKKEKPGPKPHNLSEKGKKALYAFEDHAPGTRPSRKSSRKASNRQKTDAKFRLTREAQEMVPRRPALRAAGKRR
ncbi:MAG TPA: hypothetical protein VMK42_20945 [Anaeromyxobacteraceae bacterium]|nr:hypothetical protein [Anaeromyxobacteraceae bacterium]